MRFPDEVLVGGCCDRLARLFVCLLFFPQLIYTLTKVLYQYIDNIEHLQHQLLKLGLVCINASMRVLFTL